MAARLLTQPQLLPNLDYPIIDYLSSLFSTTDLNPPDENDNPVETFVRPLLESEDIDEDDIDAVCATLQVMWDTQCGEKIANSRKPTKLERVLDMRRQEALSKKSASRLLSSGWSSRSGTVCRQRLTSSCVFAAVQ